MHLLNQTDVHKLFLIELLIYSKKAFIAKGTCDISADNINRMKWKTENLRKTKTFEITSLDIQYLNAPKGHKLILKYS